MNLLVLGLSHETAPIELRERVAFSASELGDAITSFRTATRLEEVVVLSTCNRTEIICTGNIDDKEAIVQWLAQNRHCDLAALEPSLYHHAQMDAVSHLIRVSVGLDSMIIGEPQIFGQMKDAFLVASGIGATGPLLEPLFQHIFNSTKRVRSETAIGRHSVSAPATAIALARNIFSDLRSCRALLIGAGEMTEVAGQPLIEAQVQSLTIANRTPENARELASKFNAEVIPLSELPDQLDRFDLIYSATAARLPFIGKGLMERIIKKRKRSPVFILDLAVPRDVEPEVGELPDVYLYSLDDLQSTIADNLRKRNVAADEAEALIERASLAFKEERAARSNQATLLSLRQHLTHLGEVELAKAKASLDRGTPPDKVLEDLSRGLVNKIAHAPSLALKDAGKRGDSHFIDAVSTLFALDGSNDESITD